MKTRNIFLIAVLFIFSAISCEKEKEPTVTGPVSDVDGNSYTTVTIGDQVWLKENLKTTKYNDGTPIPEITENSDWSTVGIGEGYCWYMNDESTYKNKYGALYNWWVVESDKLCPEGWHVPSDSEWRDLQSFVSQDGHHNEEGIALKTTTDWTNQWGQPDGEGTNDYGFSAYPAGVRTDAGAFTNIGMSTNWWSSSEFSEAAAISYGLSYANSLFQKGQNHKMWGRSVRCLQD